MPLNNHGLSMKEMIIYSSIMLIALFFAVFFVMQLMGEFGESFKESVTGKVTYATVERNVEEATLLYIDKYYKEGIGNDTITVLTDNLVSYNIIKESNLITSDNDSCSGYALVRKSTNDYIVAESYIVCQNYITEDFQSWRMGME